MSSFNSTSNTCATTTTTSATTSTKAGVIKQSEVESAEAIEEFVFASDPFCLDNILTSGTLVDVDAKDSNGFSALFNNSAYNNTFSSDEDRVNNVCYLLTCVPAANVNLTNDDYKLTALHRAAGNGEIAILKILLDFNADRSVRDSDNETALDVARGSRDQVEAERLLNEYFPTEEQKKTSQLACRNRIKDLFDKKGMKRFHSSIIDEEAETTGGGGGDEGKNRKFYENTAGGGQLPLEGEEEEGEEEATTALGDWVSLTYKEIDIRHAVDRVSDNSAGAISTFMGVTRDNFQGKKVTLLEYSAYAGMAMESLKALCEKMRAKWSLKKIAIQHKLGSCPIGHVSVMIAVSSDHRKESLEATHYCIDELKASVEIWKKEYYENEATFEGHVDGPTTTSNGISSSSSISSLVSSSGVDLNQIGSVKSANDEGTFVRSAWKENKESRYFAISSPEK